MSGKRGSPKEFREEIKKVEACREGEYKRYWSDHVKTGY